MPFEPPRDVCIIRDGKEIPLTPIFTGTSKDGWPKFECIGESLLPGDEYRVGWASPESVVTIPGPAVTR